MHLSNDTNLSQHQAATNISLNYTGNLSFFMCFSILSYYLVSVNLIKYYFFTTVDPVT